MLICNKLDNASINFYNDLHIVLRALYAKLCESMIMYLKFYEVAWLPVSCYGLCMLSYVNLY